MAPMCPKPSKGLPIPMRGDQNSPPSSRDQQIQCSEEKLAWEWADGEDSKYLLSPPGPRRVFYPCPEGIRCLQVSCMLGRGVGRYPPGGMLCLPLET